MKVTCTGRKIHLTEEIREKIEEKLSKTDKFESFMNDIQVVISQENETIEVELLVNVRVGKNIIIKEKDEGLFEAVDLAIDRLLKALRRVKEKTISSSHSQRVRKVAPPPDDEQEETYEDIVNNLE